MAGGLQRRAGRRMASTFVHGQGKDRAAVDDPWQIRLLLRVVAAKHQRRGADQGRGEQRRSRQLPARLFEHDAKAEIAKP